MTVTRAVNTSKSVFFPPSALFEKPFECSLRSLNGIMFSEVVNLGVKGLTRTYRAVDKVLYRYFVLST